MLFWMWNSISDCVSDCVNKVAVLLSLGIVFFYMRETRINI